MTGPANSWSEQLDPGPPFEDASQKMERTVMEAKRTQQRSERMVETMRVSRAFYEAAHDLYASCIQIPENKRTAGQTEAFKLFADASNAQEPVGSTMSDSVRVPRKPTPAMLNAAIDVDSYKLGDISPLGFRCSPQQLFERCWTAMLAAAPAPAADVTDEMVELALNQYYGANGWNTEAHSDAYRHDMRHALEAAFAALPRAADVREAVLREALTFIDFHRGNPFVDELIAKIKSALASRPAEEHAWVIELGESDTGTPVYWAGIGPGTPFEWPFGSWTEDNLKAIRFARREDATQVAQTIFDYSGEHERAKCRVCDHIWTPPSKGLK